MRDNCGSPKPGVVNTPTKDILNRTGAGTGTGVADMSVLSSLEGEEGVSEDLAWVILLQVLTSSGVA
jgi:hypothetical protein